MWIQLGGDRGIKSRRGLYTTNHVMHWWNAVNVSRLSKVIGKAGLDYVGVGRSSVLNIFTLAMGHSKLESFYIELVGHWLLILLLVGHCWFSSQDNIVDANVWNRSCCLFLLPAEESPNLQSPSHFRPKVARYLNKKCSRKRVPWSHAEVSWLKKGVMLFGVGNWVDIKTHFPFSYNRIPADLKDKWRNLPQEEKKEVLRQWMHAVHLHSQPHSCVH